MTFASEHWGVDNLFNIREANPDVECGQWQFELNGLWFSQERRDDRVMLWQTLKYGITDDLYAELEVREPYICESSRDSGAGDSVFRVFWRVLRETDCCPALAFDAAVRAPSGCGSSGVDGTARGMVTKTLGDCFRVHFNGFVQTANGHIGRERFDRRHFQWGAGPGVDYRLSENTVVLANYLHRVNEEYGESNQQIVEVGLIHNIPTDGNCQHAIKVGGDVTVDGRDSTPHLGAKLQYQVTWK
ncbi:MAG TPA: hypothetical protein P5223_09710 [Phycisphaerae bacterium]|jgi:hypothetical protein|nr:hypothetical protein [Phycisphaerae bacterium]